MSHAEHDGWMPQQHPLNEIFSHFSRTFFGFDALSFLDLLLYAPSVFINFETNYCYELIVKRDIKILRVAMTPIHQIVKNILIAWILFSSLLFT